MTMLNSLLSILLWPLSAESSIHLPIEICFLLGLLQIRCPHFALVSSKFCFYSRALSVPKSLIYKHVYEIC